MGSGHFLVTAVDDLSDDIAGLVEYAPVYPEWLDGEYESPLVGRIASIRDDILLRAEESNWILDEAQLTDQAIIRRMVLKRCIYGVDKNPLTVELAKVSLWLHSFTVGAPLSFLDHHLRCGDSRTAPRGADLLHKSWPLDRAQDLSNSAATVPLTKFAAIVGLPCISKVKSRFDHVSQTSLGRGVFPPSCIAFIAVRAEEIVVNSIWQAEC